MADAMIFPNTVEEFMEQYKVVDTDQIYSNGIEFVPIFRMEQWFEHVADVAPVRRGRWTERGSSEYECPFCRKIIFADDERERNYCPCCGAKMDMSLFEWARSQAEEDGGEP